MAAVALFAASPACVGFAVQQSRISIVALLILHGGVLALAGGGDAAGGVFPWRSWSLPFRSRARFGRLSCCKLWVIKASSGLAHGAASACCRAAPSSWRRRALPYDVVAPAPRALR